MREESNLTFSFLVFPLAEVGKKLGGEILGRKSQVLFDIVSKIDVPVRDAAVPLLFGQI